MRLRGMGITRKPSTRRAKGAAHVLQSAAAGRYTNYEQMMRDIAANQSDYDKEQEKVEEEKRVPFTFKTPAMVRKLKRFIFRARMGSREKKIVSSIVKEI